MKLFNNYWMPVQNALPFAFPLSFDRAGALRVFLYHCRKAHDDGGLRCNVFWKFCIRESEIDGDRTNDSIASFIRL